MRIVGVGLALTLGVLAQAAPAPGFTLETLSGGHVSLSDFGGQVVVIDFWATWCGPCKLELPHLQALSDDLGPRGVTVLTVSTDEASALGGVKAYVRRSHLTLPVLRDGDSKVLSAYNPAGTLPFTVIVGANGEVVSTHSGYTSGDEQALREQVEAQIIPVAAPPSP